jgi:methyl-accepting chemotaxis protein
MAREDGVDADALTTPREVLQFFVRYEAGVATGRDLKIRTPLVRNADRSIQFACGMPEGVQVELTRTNPALQIEAAREAARQARVALGDQRVGSAIVFDCVCRKLLLGDGFVAATQAVSGALGGVPLAGFECYGEIALNVGDLSGFHNSTSVALVFPE